MIPADFARTMARYNAWQNRNLFDAADTLEESERRRDRGAFFGSIQRTLSHLIWADHIWMSRLDRWEAPQVGLADSPEWITAWSALKSKRRITDARIQRWANALTEAALAGEVTWFSGATRREMTKPRALLVQHVFNHQTHHRGQVHAMLTAAGEDTGATDLPFVLPG